MTQQPPDHADDPKAPIHLPDPDFTPENRNWLREVAKRRRQEHNGEDTPPTPDAAKPGRAGESG